MSGVNLAHIVSYWVVIPILILLGIVSSVIGIKVIGRSIQIKEHVKTYFMMLSVCDLILCLSYIPIAISANGCIFNSYFIAKYFAHFGWSIPAILHSQCAFLLFWLALDRCLAVWYDPGYKFIQQPRIQLIRAIGTAAFLVAIHIPYMVDAEVDCVPTGGTGNRTVKDVGADDVEEDQTCEQGHWTTNDGFQKSFNDKWHEILRWFYSVIVRWGPAVFLVGCNLSLVVGVVKGKIQAHAVVRKGEGRNGAKARAWERNLVLTMIAMATSYLVLTLPITVFLTSFAEYIKNRCTESDRRETLRHVANILQLVEHVLHTTFLACLNPKIRRELCYSLHQAKENPRPQSMMPPTLEGLTSDTLTQ